jgi:histone deacetylase complex regulatory component SIN3
MTVVVCRIGIGPLIDRVIAALHGYPHLIAGFNPFLPLPYEVQSSKDPEDPLVSIVSITTPTGHETRRLSLHPDLWSLAPRQPPQDEFKLMIELINDVKKLYADDPTVFRAFLQAIQPNPDNPKDKVNCSPLKQYEALNVHSVPGHQRN